MWGDVEVTVIGREFAYRNISCRLNSTVTAARYINNTHAACTVPAGTAGGDYRIGVSNDAFDVFTVPQTLSVFEFGGISPRAVSFYTNTTLYVLGANFKGGWRVACAAWSASDGDMRFNGTVVNATHAACTVPGSLWMTTLNVSLELDGVAYRAAHAEFSTLGAVPAAVQPWLVLQRPTDYEVIVRGSGFVRHNVSCALNGSTTAARYINFTHVGCTVPGRTGGGLWVVGVRNDGRRLYESPMLLYLFGACAVACCCCVPFV